MSEDRRQILQMLADGKVSADEADRLLSALEGAGAPAPLSAEVGPRRRPKYLRVVVDATDGSGPVKVNIRVPMQLLRAGVRLGSLIPSTARDQVNEALHKQGVGVDINQLKPENLEALIDELNDLTVDVDQEDAKVRVFCE